MCTRSCKCLIFCGLTGLGVFLLTFVLVNQWYGNPLKRRILSALAPECTWEESDDIADVDLSDEIHRAIDIERQIVIDELKGYPYPGGKYGINATKFEDLTIETNGRPVRSFILSSYRSGSNFLGDIFNAHPATFFQQEPLSDFGYVQVRGPPLDTLALDRIRAMFNCEYAGLDNHIEFTKHDTWALSYNKRVWEQCKTRKDLCYDKKYLASMCRLFPFHLMKLVRLSLNVAQEILSDEKLGVRMILLVRDPRGSLQSRKHHCWCRESRDCCDSALLCADLASDYRVAIKLVKKYPNTFRVIRYEDLAAETYERVKEISEFFGLEFHRNMKVYLDTHTKYNDGGPYDTTRNTKTTPYHWKTDLEFEEVDEIQRTCATAMKYWGYVPAINATHQREFNPVTNYSLNSRYCSIEI